MDESINIYKTCNNSDLCNRESVCLDNPNCLFCDDEKCENQDTTFQHTCIECDSTLGQECNIVKPNQQQVDCRNSHQIGCYHYEKGSNNFFHCHSLVTSCKKNIFFI